ncbi:hypothetical protein BJX76DRAFT_52435 [Aspergillus varians]
MSPQGITRKRPAPGTSPIVHPQLGQLPNYPPTSGSPLSNDQFLQWGQNPSSNTVSPSSFPDTYNTGALPPPTHDSTASNQLARRQPASQMANRNRSYEQPSASLPEQGPESAGWTESLEELYQRATTAKRDAQAKRKQIPPFVQKLSSFLDESKNTELIRWSDDGDSFIVLDEDEFAKTLIPELFKHNNYASFVRQLNMYGFHKKVGLSDNSMRASERKNKSPSEYANPYFKRGHPDLLWLIQKPKNAAGQGTKSSKGYVRVKTEDAEHETDDYGDDNAGVSRDDSSRNRQLSLIAQQQPLPKDQFTNVYRELQAIRQQQQIISTTISKLRREHEQLYAQAANFQEQHTRHENSINAILTFLATVYNRSLQGQEGQNLANSFAGAISQDQGNVVDIGDHYSFGTLGATSLNSPGGPRSIKKQPLLLKAPPGSEHGRATTLSPAANAYDHPQPHSHVRPPSASQSGQVEEVFDTSPRPKDTPTSQSQQYPQRDIMSVIQNTNAQNGIPTTYSDFPNVLSSLETSGGGVPLTPNQRADMLRLMANETGTTDSGETVPQNNALISPVPPQMPNSYSSRLANTRSEIDNLMKMQAEQDRSVQNLTNLLQPLSPTGTIPGIGPDGNIPLPPLELDHIFNNDYFTDFGDYDQQNRGNVDLGDSAGAGQAPTTVEPPVADDPTIKHDGNDLFDFDHLAGDSELFGETNQHQPNPGSFQGFDNNNYSNTSTNPITTNPVLSGPGRVVESLTDSEATSPSNPIDDPNQYGTGVLDIGDNSQGGNRNGGGGKRRKKA